ncbi:MAG: hypothetical protein PG981_000681 [Wolbachia endosymbiont of Ctenocephalides orientis wCori]|nr:MAG: hypothetical protein PG981_000681 [Wolbachia endosymbiont of Ctenocephalides orientis wCori]
MLKPSTEMQIDNNVEEHTSHKRVYSMTGGI